MHWYIGRDGQQYGPFDEGRVAQMVIEGRVRDSDLIWHDGMPEWIPVTALPFLPGRSPSVRADSAPDPAYSATAAAPDDSRSDAGPSNTIHSGNYVARHWRGELSLPVSYWVNSFLLGMAAFIPVLAFNAATEVVGDPKLLFAGILALWSAIVAMTAWQVVGTWRAAGKHAGRGGSAFWAGVARVMIVLGLLSGLGNFLAKAVPTIREVGQMAFGPDPMGSYTLTVSDDGSTALLKGTIVYPLANEFRSLLAEKPGIRTVRLNSNGGRIGEARRLRDAITKAGLATETTALCASACTLAFLAGNERTLFYGAKIGFHGYRFPGLAASDLRDEITRDKRYLAERGIPAQFAERAYATPSDDMWFPTVAELRQANVITGPPRIDHGAVEAELLQIEVFRLIKEREPAEFARMLEAFAAGLLKGDGETRAADAARPLLFKIVQAYLPTASDEALVLTGGVLVDTLGELKSAPAACAAYLYPDRPRSQPLASLLSKDLQARDLASTAELVRTGDPRRAPLPPAPRAQRDLEAIGQAVRDQYGPRADLLLDQEAGSSKLSDREICSIMRDLYARVMQLPPDRSAAVLRMIFSS